MNRMGVAERAGLLYVPVRKAEQNALGGMAHDGALIRPYPGMFVPISSWDAMTVAERHLRVMRTLARMHPDWVFCGPSAALALGFNVPNSCIRRLHLMCSGEASRRSTKSVMWHHLRGEKAMVVRGMRVSSVEQTVVDCMRWLDFPRALAIADSALRVCAKDQDWLLACCRAVDRRTHGLRQAKLVTTYADARAEGGGESIARATMVEEGFSLPTLQAEIPDPLSGAPRRVDFLWTLADGQRVLGEFDGREKYRNPRMTHGKDAVDVLADERLRESHLTLDGRVMRFSWQDVRNRHRLVQLLMAYGIPQEHEPRRFDLRPLDCRKI